MHRLRALPPTTAILVCLFAAAPVAGEPEGLTLEPLAEPSHVVEVAISSSAWTPGGARFGPNRGEGGDPPPHERDYGAPEEKEDE